MKRLGLALVVSLHAIVLVGVASADGDCGYSVECAQNPDVGVSGGAAGFTTGIGYRSDGTDVSLQPSDGAPGATYEYQLAPACGPNVNGGDASCNAAFSCPNPGDIRFFVFYRELSPVAGDWQRGGDECLSPNPTAEPVREVDVSPQAAQVFNTLPVYASPILFQPDNGAVVNVPLIVRTQGAPLQGSTSAFGITVDVIATPHWHWDFGDGTSLDTDDPGPTYDGTDPRTSPHHYLAHTYPTKGTRTIRLTTTWTGTYTRSDKSGAFPVAGSVSKTSTRDVPVKEYEGRVTF